MQRWLRLLFGIPDPPPLWIPQYQERSTLWVSQPNNSGGFAVQPLDQQDFVTRETAYYLGGLFGATVTEEPYEGGGGAELSTAKTFNLHWPGGWKLNAGDLAYYFCPARDSNNSDLPGKPAQATLDNPQIAVIECNTMIASARADFLKLPR